jgi:hypothetical protein
VKDEAELRAHAEEIHQRLDTTVSYYEMRDGKPVLLGSFFRKMPQAAPKPTKAPVPEEGDLETSPKPPAKIKAPQVVMPPRAPRIAKTLPALPVTKPGEVQIEEKPEEQPESMLAIMERLSLID